MSFERSTGSGAGLGAEPAPTPGPGGVEGPGEGGVTPAMRLQILSTEHWSLLASRSLAWNESFSRADMFLSTLSGAIVALALVAQATEFGEGSGSSGWSSCPSSCSWESAPCCGWGLPTTTMRNAVHAGDAPRAGYLEVARPTSSGSS